MVVASYVFYGQWDWRFLMLIALTTLFSYISRRLIIQYEGQQKWQKALDAINIVLSLSILGVFKYYSFSAENFAALFGSIDWQIDWVTLDILLPVGISFYTFQALSYNINVYQKKLSVCKGIIASLVCINFFPQLVAGPIERATNLLPQFYKSYTFNYMQAVDGCRQMLWGLFKKMIVAGNYAAAVSLVWGNYTNQSGFTLLVGGFLFTLQIYGDFSGYSDIAIGTARLFSISLMHNFSFPYFSRDIAEFWRRWHISLTTWLRDCIYIPLGGSRYARWKAMRNTLIILLVSDLQHGANWTSIIWGVYYALPSFPLVLLGKNRKHTNNAAAGRLLPSMKEFVQILFTFLLVLIGWIIFRAENIRQAWDYLSRMCSPSLLDLYLQYDKKVLLYTFIFLMVEWLQRGKQHALQIEGTGILKYHSICWGIYILLALFTLVLAGTQAEFVYFQF